MPRIAVAVAIAPKQSAWPRHAKAVKRLIWSAPAAPPAVLLPSCCRCSSACSPADSDDAAATSHAAADPTHPTHNTSCLSSCTSCSPFHRSTLVIQQEEGASS